jgi:AcrR family transcriptional regulator
MARVAKEEERTAKRNAILDAAQRLIYSKGYEQMSIQDILTALQISKGAFYHYFRSKQAVLDGMVARTAEQAMQIILPVVQDPTLTAIEKLNHYTAASAQWKTSQKSFLVALLRIWYEDHNAIFRQKQQAVMFKQAIPLVAAIIQQGVAEGVFVSDYPEQTGEILVNLLVGIGDAWARTILADPPLPDAVPRLERLVAAYTDAMERLLGAPAGTLTLMDQPSIRAWATTA